MGRTARSLATALALVLAFWLIWSRLHFVVLVQMPWWGLLLLGVVLFLTLDYLISRIFARRP